MSAFLIATLTVKNPEKLQEYAEKAGPTFAPFGAEMLIKGKHQGTYAGDASHSTAAVIKFPNIEQMDAWYHSDAYQALIPLRDEAAEVVFSKYQD